MKQNLRRISLSLLMCAILFLSGGCVSLLVKQDTLIEVANATSDPSGQDVYSDINIISYDQIFTGSILAYDERDDKAVLTYRTLDDQGNYVSVLATHTRTSITPLYTSSLAYSEAEIDVDSDEVYFKEKDTASALSALFWSDASGNNRVRLTEDVYDSYIAWDVSAEGFLIFVNEDRHIVLGNIDEQVIVYDLPQNFNIKQISYLPEDNFILLIASTPQTSNVLYRIDLNADFPELAAIDVNVSVFSVSREKSLTAYVKTSISGEDQLYLYNHDSLLRQFICSNYIDKVSFSTRGNYIAFSTDATTEIPTQSIWIVPYDSTIPIQLTADTKLSSQIYWNDDEDALIFTRAETTDSDSGGETVYTTYELNFEFTSFNGNP